MKKILLTVFLLLCSSNANSETVAWTELNQSITYLLSNGYKIIEITEVNISNKHTRYHYHLTPISSKGSDNRPVICDVEFFYNKNTILFEAGLTHCFLEIPNH